MFSIKSVEVTNFRSFRGTHTWVFPETAGLYQLTGNNLDNPKLGRNGVGKSSLLDAILWCDYGKTSRGLRANDIVNRDLNTGPCSVMVRHVVGSPKFHKPLIVKRTQNPNSLTLNGEVVDQETLTAALGRHYDAFCYSGIIPQGRDMFFDLKSADKLTLFSEIMGLDEWLSLSHKALIKQKDLEMELGSLSGQINQLVGTIRNTERVMEEIKLKSAEWVHLQGEEIKHLTIQKEGALQEIKFRQAEIARLDTCLPELRAGIDTKTNVLKELEVKIREVEETLKSLDRELVVVGQDIKGCDKAVDQLSKIGAVCPVCAQNVDRNHMEKHISKLKANLRRYLVEQEELLELRTFTDQEHLRLTEKSNYVTREINNDLNQVNKLQRGKDLTLSELTHREREAKSIDERIEKIRKQPNNFDAMYRARQTQLNTDKGVHNKLEMAVIALNEQIAAVTYWVMGFKRIRLLIIEETLQSLELEVNNNLAQLGLADWRIEFDVERENKSGGVTKGFSVLIYDPKYDYPIKWESFSAGETQLLKLAGSLGLANLICERAGLVNMIEFFDEASSHLSTEPIGSLCELLNERAINSQRQVWIIDHNAIDYGGFDGVVTVVKDENGSKIT